MQTTSLQVAPVECPGIICNFELEFKKKKCCKSYKDGKRCKKCPKIKDCQA